jgi:hypothetical protein
VNLGSLENLHSSCVGSNSPIIIGHGTCMTLLVYFVSETSTSVMLLESLKMMFNGQLHQLLSFSSKMCTFFEPCCTSQLLKN